MQEPVPISKCRKLSNQAGFCTVLLRYGSPWPLQDKVLRAFWYFPLPYPYSYSIAMLIQEHMDKLSADYQIQFFGTDIDSDAINTSRLGLYPDSIAVDVVPGSIEALFTASSNQESLYRQIVMTFTR